MKKSAKELGWFIYCFIEAVACALILTFFVPSPSSYTPGHATFWNMFGLGAIFFTCECIFVVIGIVSLLRYYKFKERERAAAAAISDANSSIEVGETETSNDQV